jgi:hypothetical protein
MVVHIGSADVICLITFARKTEILGLAQCLNAVKPKLMMRGGRLVTLEDTEVILTKSHPFLFPRKK